jgi:hypothetical protein
MAAKSERISFELAPAHQQALKTLAADRQVRLSGEVRDGQFVVDAVSFANTEFSRPLFVPVNAPFAIA